MEKVLIAAPTAASKNYCLEDWLMHLNELKYPNFTVVLADNTPQGDELLNNAIHIQRVASQLPLKYPFQVIRYAGVDTEERLFARMAIGHNLCREFAIQYGYSHWLHLESDVFPPLNVIEELLAHKKQAVGALYYRDEGRSRKLMVQRRVFLSDRNIKADNVLAGDDAFIIDGTLKKYAHVGLGCIMLHKSVFRNIKFRFKNGLDVAPDAHFSTDLFGNGIDMWADTSLICEHRNVAWGVYGVDYK